MEPPLKPPNLDRAKEPLDKSIKSIKSFKTYSDRTYPFLLICVVIASFGLMLGTFVRLISSVTNQPEPNLATKAIDSSPNSSPIPVSKPEAPTSPSSEVITLAKFDRIQNGMTILQVQETIGNAGKLLGSSNVGNITGKVYWWQNQQGSNAIVEFKSDRVTSKSQAGLK